MKTFLNLTAFSPQMAYALCVFLARQRDQEEHEELIQAWLAPSTLFPKGRPPDDWGYTYALEVSEHLGLIERADGRIRLTTKIGSIDDFRRLLRDRVMERARNSSDGDEDPTNELTRALAWWSHQPPQVLTSTTFEQLMDGLPFKPIRQPARWAVFERWALFLGFTWRFGDGLVPDPTAAVDDVLEDLLPAGEAIDMPAFISAIGDRFPSLDTGLAFKRYRDAIGSTAPTDVLEAPLSMALLRLEKRGEVEFPQRADAPGITLKCGAIERRVAQIRRLEATVSR